MEIKRKQAVEIKRKYAVEIKRKQAVETLAGPTAAHPKVPADVQEGGKASCTSAESMSDLTQTAGASGQQQEEGLKVRHVHETAEGGDPSTNTSNTHTGISEKAVITPPNL